MTSVPPVAPGTNATAAKTVVANDFVGPLAKDQVRAKDVIPDEFIGPLQKGQVRAGDTIADAAKDADKVGIFKKAGDFIKGHKVATAVVAAVAVIGTAFGVMKAKAMKAEMAAMTPEAPATEAQPA